MTRFRITVLLLLGGALSSCSNLNWFFSLESNKQPDRSRPVARIELRGQPAQLGATTTEGIVFLNPDNAKGACRVHYFLGSDLIIEDGTVRELGGGYTAADIDLKTQAVSVLTRDPNHEDELVAIVLTGGDVTRIPVVLAKDEVADGYVLDWPEVDLPLGTGIFRVRIGRNAGDLQFVGLASGLATWKSDAGITKRYVTFTGPARMREVLAKPRPMFHPNRFKHRPDGISVRK
jgi:hypothetical protein